MCSSICLAVLVVFLSCFSISLTTSPGDVAGVFDDVTLFKDSIQLIKKSMTQMINAAETLAILGPVKQEPRRNPNKQKKVAVQSSVKKPSAKSAEEIQKERAIRESGRKEKKERDAKRAEEQRKRTQEHRERLKNKTLKRFKGNVKLKNKRRPRRRQRSNARLN